MAGPSASGRSLTVEALSLFVRCFDVTDRSIRGALRPWCPWIGSLRGPALASTPSASPRSDWLAQATGSGTSPCQAHALGHGRGRLRIVVHSSEMPCTFCAPFAAENGRVWPLSATGRFDAETVAAQGFPALAPRRPYRCQVSSNLPPSASIPPITFATCPDDRRGRRKVPGRFPF
jgi:hypothetical protein